MLGLDIAYMHDKFDHSSFSHSGDMAGVHQNKNGSRDLMAMHSFQGVCLGYKHLLRSTCLPNTKPLFLST